MLFYTVYMAYFYPKMLNDIFNDIINEVKFGYLKRKHPFKYCYLSSISQNKPVLRTVVLRDMTENYNLIFFTDKRSSKVNQFKENPKAEVLFYHPKKMWQIKVGGIIKIVEEDKRIKHYKQKIQGASLKDYITKQKPSSPLKNPDELEYAEDVNFCVLELIPDYIESLQLKRPNHIRCVFKKSNDWKGQFIVP